MTACHFIFSSYPSIFLVCHLNSFCFSPLYNSLSYGQCASYSHIPHPHIWQIVNFHRVSLEIRHTPSIFLLFFHLLILVSIFTHCFGFFFTPIATGGFHWRSSDSMSLQYFGPILSIVTDFSNALIWLITILFEISSSS